MICWICLTKDGIVKAGGTLHVVPRINNKYESGETYTQRISISDSDRKLLLSYQKPLLNAVFNCQVVSSVLRLEGGGRNNSIEGNLLRLEGGGNIPQDAQKQEQKAAEPPPSCLPGSGLACFSNPFLACFLVRCFICTHTLTIRCPCLKLLITLARPSIPHLLKPRRRRAEENGAGLRHVAARMARRGTAGQHRARAHGVGNGWRRRR
jgi:hypothetical protein